MSSSAPARRCDDSATGHGSVARHAKDERDEVKVLTAFLLMLAAFAMSSGPVSAQQGDTLRNSARGAATGAIIGAVAGNAGKGAAAGAVGGVVFGDMRPPPGRSTPLNNAARGAAGGAIVGAIAGNAGKGAAAGALLGALRRR